MYSDQLLQRYSPNDCSGLSSLALAGFKCRSSHTLFFRGLGKSGAAGVSGDAANGARLDGTKVFRRFAQIANLPILVDNMESIESKSLKAPVAGHHLVVQRLRERGEPRIGPEFRS